MHIGWSWFSHVTSATALNYGLLWDGVLHSWISCVSGMPFHCQFLFAHQQQPTAHGLVLYPVHTGTSTYIMISLSLLFTCNIFTVSLEPWIHAREDFFLSYSIKIAYKRLLELRTAVSYVMEPVLLCFRETNLGSSLMIKTVNPTVYSIWSDLWKNFPNVSEPW